MHLCRVQGCHHHTLLVSALIAFAPVSHGCLGGGECSESGRKRAGNMFNYRIGDTVNGFAAGYQSAPTRAGRWEQYRLEMNRGFPGTLMAAYLNRTTRAYDYDTLCDIVRERGLEAGCEDLPPPTAAVVHLRLGDVVDRQGRNVDVFTWSCLSYGRPPLSPPPRVGSPTGEGVRG